jgi:enterochelin esterase-like enzyme
MARGLVAWRLAGLVACALAAAASGARASSLDGAPVSQSPPNLTGAAQQSQTMTVDAGGWAGKHLLFTYQWQRCDAQGANCAPVLGLTWLSYQRAASYTPTQADVGTTLRVGVTATNAAGSATAVSTPSGVIVPTGAQLPAAQIGQLHRFVFASPAVGRTQYAYVYVPPGYDQHRRYPVLYLLHGYPGGPESYIALVPVADALDHLLARHAVRPFLVVMPYGAPDFQTQTSWVDGPAGPWESFLARDVVQWTDRCFSTNPAAAARGLAGFSDGGYGALNIALHHPGEFGLVESWSGYSRADPTETQVYGNDQALLDRNSPTLTLSAARPALARTGTYFWLYIGVDDPGGIADNRQFAQQLATAHLRFGFHLVAGSHLPSVYASNLAAALTVASRHLQAKARRTVAPARLRAPDCAPQDG